MESKMLSSEHKAGRNQWNVYKVSAGYSTGMYEMKNYQINKKNQKWEETLETDLFAPQKLQDHELFHSPVRSKDMFNLLAGG